MESLFTTSFIESVGYFMNNFPVFSSLAMILIFLVRGEAATLFSVYLTEIEILTWPKFLIIGFFSILLGDIVLYYIGRYGKETKLINRFEKKIKSSKKLKKILQNHTAKALILTKYTMGLGSLTIVLSGWSKIPFKKFFKINLVADLLWFGFVILLSFILIKVFGFFEAKESFDFLLMILGAGIIIFLLGEYFMQKFFKKESGVDDIDED